MRSIFVFNPESGKGKLKKYENFIIENLSKKYGEIDCVETTHSGHAQELAKQSVGKYDYFFVAGGDGTLNEVVNGFGNHEQKPVLGYLPCGTVNDIARSLGISRNIKKAVKQLLDGEIFNHDTFKVNDKYGIYVCCAGLFTTSSYQTQRKYKKHLGKIAYFFHGAKDIFKAKPVKIGIEYDGHKFEQSCSLLLILNNRSVAGFKLNKNAELNDGQVEVILVHCKPNKVTFGNILHAMKLVLFGVEKYKNSKKITYLKLSKFKLEMQSNTIINLDGEKSGAGNFDFEVLQGSLNIIVPKK